jgi:phage repressor protein C with HTH and peptisase S24 domain
MVRLTRITTNDMNAFEIEDHEGDGNPIVFREEWFRARNFKPEKLIATTVDGASMEPTLHHGDVIIINTEDKTLVSGEVFLLANQGAIAARRLMYQAGKWVAHCDNPDARRFKPEPFDGSIVGRVVYRQSERL